MMRFLRLQLVELQKYPFGCVKSTHLERTPLPLETIAHTWTGRTGQRGLLNMGQTQSYEDESPATRRMPRRMGDGIISHSLS